MSKEKLQKSMDFANRLVLALEDLLSNEDSEFYISVEELEEGNNLTDFIHALANLAPATVYTKLTNDDKNLLEFNHLANQLCFQYSVRE